MENLWSTVVLSFSCVDSAFVLCNETCFLCSYVYAFIREMRLNEVLSIVLLSEERIEPKALQKADKHIELFSVDKN